MARIATLIKDTVNIFAKTATLIKSMPAANAEEWKAHYCVTLGTQVEKLFSSNSLLRENKTNVPAEEGEATK